jgi:L-threonylcarbamoyladenylate synthase
VTDVDERIAAAVDAVRAGEAVVYPTETVYGLGADATDPDAVEGVFDLKRRPRDRPLSAGFHAVDAALEFTAPTAAEVEFMRAFLPGPVTVVVDRGDRLPAALTGGRERVGVRIPDHDLARALLREAGPLTATSANVSGEPSVVDPAALDDRIREGAGAVIDGGAVGGAESTVVDVSTGDVHRRGAMAGAVEAWLAQREGRIGDAREGDEADGDHDRDRDRDRDPGDEADDDGHGADE